MVEGGAMGGASGLHVPGAKCAICLEEMALEQTKLNCGHLFCESCACEWYAKNPSCATCRAPTTSAVTVTL